ncbi:hypothetical protein [Nocardia carnea]|uniref:hypothetical protein n=1 Tax=Nocardia carnea TaxID=37328 RepID=UPI00245427AC|nr:hypothetical protein [Nocardia carnea]
MNREYDDTAFLPLRERRIAEEHLEKVAQWGRTWQQGVRPVPVEQPDPKPFYDVAERSERICQQLLKVLSPRAAISAWWSSDSKARRLLSHHTLFNRFLWVLAVGASGSSEDPVVLDRFFAQTGRWWVASRIADSYTARETEISMAAQMAPGREFLTRTSSHSIRYHWVTRVICTEIGRQIEADEAYGAALPQFTFANIERCMEIALEFGRRGDGTDLTVTPWSDPAADFIAENLSHQAGELAGKDFSELAMASGLETRPWISFTDGVAPIALGTIRLGMDRALLHAVDRQLLRHRKTGFRQLDKGELFERVAQECLRQSLGRLAGSKPPRPLTIEIPGERRPDIDVAIVDHRVRIIGEVKAMEAPAEISSVDRAFSQQVSKVAKQLTKRLSALDNGMPVTDGAGATFPGHRRTIALGIVLHHYSGSLTYPEMLNLLPNAVVDPRIAIADLHAWIIVLNTMGSFKEIAEYLEFRYELLNLGVVSVEECDMAVAFHNPHRGKDVIRLFRKALERNSELSKAFYLQGMYVSAHAAVEHPQPTDPAQWKREFYDEAQPVPIW